MTTFGRKSSLATKVSEKVEHELKLKRVYEAPHKDDGTRILVDRLWPRGLTKGKGEGRSLVERNRSQHGASKMVRTRSEEMAKLSQALLGASGAPERGRLA